MSTSSRESDTALPSDTAPNSIEVALVVSEPLVLASLITDAPAIVDEPESDLSSAHLTPNPDSSDTTSIAGSHCSGRSDESHTSTVVDPGVPRRPAQVRHRQTQRSTTEPARVLPTLSLSTATNASQVFTTSPIAQSPEQSTIPPSPRPSRLPGGPVRTRSIFVGDNLDPEVQEELDKLIEDGLRPCLPSGVQDAIYERYVGLPSLPLDGRPPVPQPDRMPSGPLDSFDDLDKSREFCSRNKLEESKWREVRHPENNVVFILGGHTSNSDCVVMTDEFILQEHTLKSYHAWANLIISLIEKQRARATSRWPQKYHVYIQLGYGENGKPECRYYIVDMEKHRPFWLHSLDYKYVFENSLESLTSRLAEHHLELEFWCHSANFPIGRCIEDSWQDVYERILVHQTNMSQCYTYSIAPFSVGQASEWLDILDRCTKVPDTSCRKIWIIARFMITTCKNDIIHRAHDLGARLDRRQPSLENAGTKQPQSWSEFLPFVLLHVLCFGGDASYMEKIREVTDTNHVSPAIWQELMQLLVESSNQTNIISALLFAANLGFLAIQDLQEAQAVCGGVSALISITSLLIGTLHTRQHAKLLRSTAFHGSPYLDKARKSWLGYRGLALQYALANALLAWAILFLVSALLLWIFQVIATGWASRSSVLVVIIILLVVLGCSVEFSSSLTADIVRVDHWRAQCAAQKAIDNMRVKAENCLRGVHGPSSDEETLPQHNTGS